MFFKKKLLVTMLSCFLAFPTVTPTFASGRTPLEIINGRPEIPGTYDWMAQNFQAASLELGMLAEEGIESEKMNELLKEIDRLYEEERPDAVGDRFPVETLEEFVEELKKFLEEYGDVMDPESKQELEGVLEELEAMLEHMKNQQKFVTSPNLATDMNLLGYENPVGGYVPVEALKELPPLVTMPSPLKEVYTGVVVVTGGLVAGPTIIGALETAGAAGAAGGGVLGAGGSTAFLVAVDPNTMANDLNDYYHGSASYDSGYYEDCGYSAGYDSGSGYTDTGSGSGSSTGSSTGGTGGSGSSSSSMGPNSFSVSKDSSGGWTITWGGITFKAGNFKDNGDGTGTIQVDLNEDGNLDENDPEIEVENLEHGEEGEGMTEENSSTDPEENDCPDGSSDCGDEGSTDEGGITAESEGGGARGFQMPVDYGFMYQMMETVPSDEVMSLTDVHEMVYAFGAHEDGARFLLQWNAELNTWVDVSQALRDGTAPYLALAHALRPIGYDRAVVAAMQYAEVPFAIVNANPAEPIGFFGL